MGDQILPQEGVLMPLQKAEDHGLVPGLLLVEGLITGDLFINAHFATSYTSSRRCRKVGSCRRTSSTRVKSMSA